MTEEQKKKMLEENHSQANRIQELKAALAHVDISLTAAKTLSHDAMLKFIDLEIEFVRYVKQ